MRTVGVEEELLLVRSYSGRAISLAPQVLRRVEELWHGASGEWQDGEARVDGELQRQQVETDTQPLTRMADVREELLAWRRHADAAARREGARVAALGTSPIAAEPRTGADERYGRILDRFGLTAAEQLSCGCHVHVQVDSDDEAIGVLDRIRVWLPALLALSANSPYWQGQDSAYASFRSQVMSRWPVSGPPDVYGSAEAYQRSVEEMVASGVLLDAGMVYLDARPSRSYPTVEIRVADVCQDVEDAVLIAALSRGLVETAAREWRAGTPAPPVPTRLLQLATWQASRDGLGGNLLDPSAGRPRRAADVVGDLVRHVRPALEAAGDAELVDASVHRVLTTGTGADHQRQTMDKTGSLSDVVAAAVRVTNGLVGVET